MGKLYRGVSKSLDKANNGKIIPRGDKIKVPMRYGDGARYKQVTYGESELNTVRAHHLESGKYDGCFISTTRCFDNAVKFATNMGERGYVYIIDESLLESSGVIVMCPSDPEFPDEQEVSIRAIDGGEIPMDIVVSKMEIFWPI